MFSVNAESSKGAQSLIYWTRQKQQGSDKSVKKELTSSNPADVKTLLPSKTLTLSNDDQEEAE